MTSDPTSPAEPPMPENEEARLEALQRYRILDTAPEQAYDDLARVAARACGTPRAAIHFLDEHRQWVKAAVGDGDYTGSRERSFCAYTICDPGEVLVVPDARKDPRFQDSPFLDGAPPIVFYAGAPILSAEGHALGTVCVFDDEPSGLDADGIETLRALSRQLSTLLEVRRMGLLWRHISDKLGQSL